MRGHLQQGRRELVAGWLVAAVATAVYLLTLDRSVSWWDCGEFIATSYTLQVGHPPGAPLYQLLAHCLMLLSFGRPLWVAPLGNALSALSGGLTAMLLFRSLCLLARHAGFVRRVPLAAAVGTGCYLFCDTAWFSAVESEVYSLAMLFCSLDLWLMLRWRQRRSPRLLLLLALLLGLGVCVHLMTLLVVPALLWIFFRAPRPGTARLLPMAALFFLLGLSPYAIIPIRATAHPPINQMGDSFISYVRRDQYPKAPLYPRLWRDRDREHWAQWGADDPGSLADNAKYCLSYQLGYMYFRYLMYNFIGRESLAYRPDAAARLLPAPRFVLFVFPFLLGLVGMVAHWRRRRDGFAAVLLLFLFGGVVLNLYLNHPCYEPRERDYAYVLSFYAFALWVGLGAAWVLSRWPSRWVAVALCLVPLSVAAGNWPDHDRSRNRLAHDIAAAHLNECAPDALLITYGDNDTFPLWYLQQVERLRTDVSVHNVNLEGYHAVRQLLDDNAFRRPVYLTQYTYDALARLFPGHARCEGFCWRLLPSAGEAALLPQPEPLIFSAKGYVDPVSQRFLDSYRENFSLPAAAVSE